MTDIERSLCVACRGEGIIAEALPGFDLCETCAKDRSTAESQKYGPFPRPCHCGKATITGVGNWHALTDGNHYWHGCYLYPKTEPCETCHGLGRRIVEPGYTVDADGRRQDPILAMPTQQREGVAP